MDTSLLLISLPLCVCHKGHYGDQLAKLMNKMVLVSQVAQLGKKLQKASQSADQKPFTRDST